MSACLLGQPVRYDGTAKAGGSAILARWQAEGRLVIFCPEVAAGFPVPRPPAEIVGGSGPDVRDGSAIIRERGGRDVTALFRAGAEAALARALAEGCRYALLADGSPSCGSRIIHDGSFTNTRHAGEGITATLLRDAGIEVFAHHEIDRLAARLERV